MKKKLVTIILISAITMFMSCSNNSPKGVAQKFLKDLQEEKFDDAKKYGTEATGKMLDVAKSFSNLDPGSIVVKDKKWKKKYVITDVQENGDKAVVKYKEEGGDAEETLEMSKINGRWMVDIRKEEVMKKNDEMAHADEKVA